MLEKNGVGMPKTEQWAPGQLAQSGKKLGRVVGGVTGGVVVGAGGAAAGAAIGAAAASGSAAASVVGVPFVPVCAAVGAVVGAIAGAAVGSAVGGHMGESTGRKLRKSAEDYCQQKLKEQTRVHQEQLAERQRQLEQAEEQTRVNQVQLEARQRELEQAEEQTRANREQLEERQRQLKQAEEQAEANDRLLSRMRSQFNELSRVSDQMAQGIAQQGGMDRKIYVSRVFRAQSALTEAEKEFYCPITEEIMRDPVQVESGLSYEREAIVGWYVSCIAGGMEYTCPSTRRVLSVDPASLPTNIQLRNLINAYRESSGLFDGIGGGRHTFFSSSSASEAASSSAPAPSPSSSAPAPSPYPGT